MRKALMLLTVLAGCGGGTEDAAGPADGLRHQTLGTIGATPVPLTDLAGSDYFGFDGGLYPDGNAMPVQHGLIGRNRARHVVPRGRGGQPDSAGRIVVLSIGMSETAEEWCGEARPDGDCNAWSLAAGAAADPARRNGIVFVNGARRGGTATSWTDPDQPDYARIDTQLLRLGLSPLQVQVAWVKTADAAPVTSLPSRNADAFILEAELGQVARALKARYPNLQQIFLGSPIYGGYAESARGSEPFAYESGFAVKWLIGSQIAQEAGRSPMLLAGDLSPAAAPWIGWGPYLWAAGRVPRSDGLTWEPADYESDLLHPSARGEAKVARELLRFFQTSPHAGCWYRSGAVC